MLPRDKRQKLVLLLSLLLLGACGHQSAAPLSDPLNQLGPVSNAATGKETESGQTPHQRRLTTYLNAWRGVPHRHGGLDHGGVDCSGLVYRAYKDIYGIELPRTTKQQSRRGRKVSATSLKPGDLVFFKTGLFQRHVGIYVGAQSFVHASRSQGVTRSALHNPYWAKRYWKAMRVLHTRSVRVN